MKDNILAYLRHHFPNLDFIEDEDGDIRILKGEDFIGHIECDDYDHVSWSVYDKNGDDVDEDHYIFDDDMIGNWVKGFNWDWLKEHNDGIQ